MSKGMEDLLWEIVAIEQDIPPIDSDSDSDVEEQIRKKQPPIQNPLNQNQMSSQQLGHTFPNLQQYQQPQQTAIQHQFQQRFQ